MIARHERGGGGDEFSEVYRETSGKVPKNYIFFKIVLLSVFLALRSVPSDVYVKQLTPITEENP